MTILDRFPTGEVMIFKIFEVSIEETMDRQQKEEVVL